MELVQTRENDHLSQMAPVSSRQWLSSSDPNNPGAGTAWFPRVGPGRTGTFFYLWPTRWIDDVKRVRSHAE